MYFWLYSPDIFYVDPIVSLFSFCYVKAFRSLQQSLNFPQSHEHLDKAAQLIFTVKKFEFIDDYEPCHDSISTALLALKATCTAEISKHHDGSEMSKKCHEILGKL